MLQFVIIIIVIVVEFVFTATVKNSVLSWLNEQ